MDRISRATAVVTLIAVVFHGAFPASAATAATIEGTVEIPCDPSMVSEVSSVRIRSVSGRSVTTVVVDPSTGAFAASGLTAGEYELNAIGAEGRPLSPEPKRLLLQEGSNRIVLSMQPPGCGGPDTRRKKRGRTGQLENWHLTLIYLGAIAVVVFALSDEDDEDPASPFQRQ